MGNKQLLQVFEQYKVRTVWDEESQKWYFSIVDVCAVLTDSKDATAYWRKLKQRLKEEGNETVTNCHALKLRAADGKMRMTDVADTEQLFRLLGVCFCNSESLIRFFDHLKCLHTPAPKQYKAVGKTQHLFGRKSGRKNTTYSVGYSVGKLVGKTQHF